jgi:dTDP-4-dehydrorhamnose reductase
MVGSMVVRVLAEELGAGAVTATYRPGGRIPRLAAAAVPFDALTGDPSELLGAVGAPWIVNAIGQIKPHIDEASSASRRTAIELNAVFPHRLAEVAERTGARALTIGTDAVFSGRAGPYAESSPVDPVDLYGMSKSLGEVVSPQVMHLRTSVIGPEVGSTRSLLEWLLTRPDGATVEGFVDHRWNGVTTLHLAKVVAGIVRTGAFEPGVRHVVPADAVTKFDLLAQLIEACHRDITVVPRTAGRRVDRRLETEHGDANVRRWSAAGYEQVPTIRSMVGELAEHPLTAGARSMTAQP